MNGLHESNHNPVLAEVTRGNLVESRHCGAFAVVNVGGETIQELGNVDRPTFARSSIKPLQALPLLESGAADAFGLSEAEIALACASHNGEPMHVNAVRHWLGRVGLDETALECGAHLPYHEPTAHNIVRKGEPLSGAHNNCSGKHSGLLTTAVHLSENISGYIDAEHPVQRRLRKVLEELTDTDLRDAPTGVDGCGIPVIGMSLRATAYAMARFGSPNGLGDRRAAAATRIFRAINAEPFMIAGTDRFCTDAMSLAPGRMLVKTGAEAFFCATIPELALGIALKIDDGNKRASEPVMAALLGEMLDVPALSARQRVTLNNVAGTEIGAVRACGV